jgi:phytoene dehydrogenase-like protein
LRLIEVAKNYAYDAAVIGSGPNGLAAAITIAQSGHSVIVYEAQPTIGGGARSENLTAPGFIHDVCSAVYPLAIGSPFFRTLPLNQHGLGWIQPPAPLAHPLDDGTAVVLERSVEVTSDNLDVDKKGYRKIIQPLVDGWDGLANDILAPPRFPQRPFSFARFGLHAILPARRFAERVFAGPRARALFAGLAAHSMLPLEFMASAAFGLVLGVAAHALGWPIARGGAQKLADALASHLRQLGGEIVVNRRITTLDEIASCRVVLCDLTPRQLLNIAGHRLSARYRQSLERYRYGMGAFKMDWALSGPVPWKAAPCARAATVHLGGTLEEIALSERLAWHGEHAEKPFVLAVQPSLFDESRAPAGKHTLWAYCHVPNGSTFDMSERIEAQIERFAPGFRDLVVARNVMAPLDLERRNANLVGGDINGGAAILQQLFFRPTAKLYKTSAKGIYICSSSTPPGGGVHGMCGYFAARQALKVLR